MQPFVIELRNLASGASSFEWKAGREFFETFGNPDILNAEITVRALVNNHGGTIGVKASIKGFVSVPCDRCLEELPLGVDTSFEENYAPDGMSLDLGQDIYDYVMTSLPMQRIHPEGGCNSETTKYLNAEQ